MVRFEIEVLLRGRGGRGTRKIPPGISQEILRNFLREAALSGDRRGRFSLSKLQGGKRYLIYFPVRQLTIFNDCYAKSKPGLVKRRELERELFKAE